MKPHISLCAGRWRVKDGDLTFYGESWRTAWETLMRWHLNLWYAKGFPRT